VPDRLEIGRIGRPHGLRGEVTVLAVTDRAERFEPGSRLFTANRVLEVVEARRHREGWIVRFAGVDGREAAEGLRGLELSAPPLDHPDDDSYWVHELVGLVVRDADGTDLGQVVAVEANPAHDLLVLDTGHLVPMPFVRGVERDIVVDLPEGLLELQGEAEEPG